jgi:MFS family permease
MSATQVESGPSAEGAGEPGTTQTLAADPAQAEPAPAEPTEAAAEAPLPSLWHNGDFLKFWFGETVSLYGTQVTTLALPLTALLVFNASAQVVGLLRFLQLVPYLLLALVFGAWVDRRKRRPVLILANVVRVVLIGAIPVLQAVHLLSLPLLLILATMIGIASVLFDVSWMSFVPTVVRDPRQYVEANQKLAVTSSSSDVAGPGIAGVLISALSAPTALVVDAASYLTSLVTLVGVRTREPEPPAKPVGQRRNIPAEVREGVSFVYRHEILRPLAIIGPFCNFSLIAVWTVFLIYAARTEQLSTELIGVIFSASSVGGLIGGLLSRKVIKRFRLGLVYAVSMSAVFLGPLLIPAASGPEGVRVAVFIASFFISYLGLGIANVVMISLRQTCTPQPMMGRMNAAFRTVLFGGGSLGGLLGGFIAGAAGLTAGLTGLAIGSAGVVVLVLASPVSRLRELPQPLAAATTATAAATATASAAADQASTDNEGEQ